MRAAMNETQQAGPKDGGNIVSVRGSVVDARFPGRLPPILNVLRAGDEEDIVIEVVSHLDARRIRGM